MSMISIEGCGSCHLWRKMTQFLLPRLIPGSTLAYTPLVGRLQEACWCLVRGDLEASCWLVRGELEGIYRRGAGSPGVQNGPCEFKNLFRIHIDIYSINRTRFVDQIMLLPF